MAFTVPGKRFDLERIVVTFLKQAIIETNDCLKWHGDKSRASTSCSSLDLGQEIGFSSSSSTAPRLHFAAGPLGSETENA